MNKLLLFITFLLLVSCSTTDVEARAQWILVDNPNAKKVWRTCKEQIDGIEKHHKGFCYIIKECRKKFLRKRECRPVPLFCAWGDDQCYIKYGLYNKRLM